MSPRRSLRRAPKTVAGLFAALLALGGAVAHAEDACPPGSPGTPPPGTPPPGSSGGSTTVTTPPKRPGSKGDGFKFAPPDEAASPAMGGAQSPSKTVPAAPPVPLDPVDALIQRMRTWPDSEGIKAAEALLLTQPPPVENCLRAIAGPDASVKPGVAWVLGKIGSPVHVSAVLTAAADRQSGSRLDVFFDAALELDVATTKKWLFNFLTLLNRPIFRARATEYLAGIVTPEDRPRIDNLLRAAPKYAGVRVAGLELLAKMKAPDAADKLVAALSDPHPDVALRASQLLADAAPNGDATLVARLNALTRDGDARERSYATLALVERCRRTRLNAFESATVPALAGRRGLIHPDQLCRAASALGLAFGALDSTDPAVAVLIDNDVISVLIQTAGGDHFLDYGSVVEPIFAALRRLSGVDYPPLATPWAQWWMQEQGRFHARRTLARVVDEDLPRSRVVFDVVDADGRRRNAQFIAEDSTSAPDGAYVLPTPAFRALIDGVEDAGIFAQPEDQRTLADEHLAVRVVVANQEKRMVLVPSQDDPRHGVLRARLDAIEEGNRWQRYRDARKHPDAAAWRREQAATFSGLDPEARRQRLLAMIVASFEELASDALRLEALDQIDRDAARLTDEQAVALLDGVARAKSFGLVEERTVELLASLGRPTLSDPLVEALARSSTPAAKKTLSNTLSAAGPSRIREAFADPRPGVRAAAATAAADMISGPLGRDPTAKSRLATMFNEGLRALLVDKDPVVGVRAAAALALLGEPQMLEKLESFYRDGSTATRIAVAQGLGRVGGTGVQPTLVRIIGEPGPEAPPVRAAALEALAAAHSPDAVHILAFYMLDDADAGVRSAAERALVALGSDDARLELARLLDTGGLEPAKRAQVVKTLSGFEGPELASTLGRFLEDPDQRVQDEAALGLAEQREGVAVTSLIAILKRPEEPLRPRAVEALKNLTCITLLVTSYDAVAASYERWYTTHRQGSDRAWFRDAAAKRGFDTVDLGGYVNGQHDLKAVPVLLKTIRDDDPVLRRASDVALRRVTGIASIPRITTSTTREEARVIADRWSSWWSRQSRSAPADATTPK